MDLIKLHNTCKSKGFYYFTGHTNNREENIYMKFSQFNGGRGDTIEIEITPENVNLEFYVLGKSSIERTQKVYNKVKKEEVCDLILKIIDNK